MKLKRKIIYPCDVQRITGRTDRYGRLYLKRIKKHFNKENHQFVTVEEFCEYSGMKIEEIAEYLTY